MQSATRRLILRRISSAALKYWKDLARAELSSTRRAYIGALKRTSLSASKAVISLTGEKGPVPFLVELGYTNANFGDLLLQSRRTKTDKTGRRYIDIYSDRFGGSDSGFLRYSERSKPWSLTVRPRNFSDKVIRAIPTIAKDAVSDVVREL